MLEEKIKQANDRGYLPNLLQLTLDTWVCTLRKGTDGGPCVTRHANTMEGAVLASLQALDEKEGVRKIEEIDLDDLL